MPEPNHVKYLICLKYLSVLDVYKPKKTFKQNSTNRERRISMKNNRQLISLTWQSVMYFNLLWVSDSQYEPNFSIRLYFSILISY